MRLLSIVCPCIPLTSAAVPTPGRACCGLGFQACLIYNKAGVSFLEGMPPKTVAAELRSAMHAVWEAAGFKDKDMVHVIMYLMLVFFCRPM